MSPRPKVPTRMWIPADNPEVYKALVALQRASSTGLPAELGELVIDDETGVEYEVVSLDPPRLEAAPQEAEDWGE